jgi:phage-related protein
VDDINLRPISRLGSSLDDLKDLPKSVQREIGFSLHQVQEGKTPLNAKPLKGIGSGVLEIVSDYNKNTYRAVYAVKPGNDIYVLHVFQKKSKHKIETPKREIELVIKRLAIAKEDAKTYNIKLLSER